MPNEYYEDSLSGRLEAIADSGDCGGGFDELVQEAKVLENALKEALGMYKIRTELNENQRVIIEQLTAEIAQLRDRLQSLAE